jgi:hypothetical protein
MINLRFFMKFNSYPMTTKFVHDTVSAGFGISLNNKTNISEPVARFNLLNSKIDTMQGGFNQILSLSANFSYGKHP